MGKSNKNTSGLIPLSERSKEERKRISQMGVETRKKNKEEKLMLQKCMKTLLNMDVSTSKRKKLLESYGFTDEQMNNRVLLMVALFQKGISGDVSAIKEITQMIDKLDLYDSTGTLQQNVIINLIPADDGFVMDEETKRELAEVEEEEDV